MQDNYKTPYKISMENAKKNHPDSENLYTQERVAEMVDKSPGTVFNWFAGVSRPDDDSVLKMAAYFDDVELPREHLYYWEPLVCKYFPKSENKGFAQAVINLDLIMDELGENFKSLKRIAMDDKITPDEKPVSDQIKDLIRKTKSALDEVEKAQLKAEE